MPDGSDLVAQDEISKLIQQATASNAAANEAASAPASSDAESTKIGADEIEALIRGNTLAAAASTASSAPLQPLGHGLRAEGAGNIAPGDIDFLLSQAEQALASINSPAEIDAAAGVIPFRLVDFSGAPASTDNATIDLIRDVELDVKIELGRTQMYLEDVLKLSKGAVVPLDKLAGDPVDIYVNGRLIAHGEVLILNDNFCVRVAELVAGEGVAAT